MVTVRLDWLALHLKVGSEIDYLFLEFIRSYVDKFNVRPGATKGTLRRKNENSFFDVLCLITFHWSF